MKEGFEPSITSTKRYKDLANLRLKPLSHFTKKSFAFYKYNIKKAIIKANKPIASTKAKPKIA